MGRLKLIIFLVLTLPQLSIASPYYGAAFSFIVSPSEPATLHGYHVYLSYDPERFQWRAFNVYFDGGAGHYWITNRPYYTALTIYTLSPVIRYTFKKRGPVSPYLELGIGLAYFNHTHIDDRNLGMHPAFQDRLGIGFSVGTKQQFSISARAMHYSNAKLSAHNNGITIPMEVVLGYRFS